MNEIHDEKADEARIEALLKQAGARVTPPMDVMNDVRAVVREDWQQLVSARKRQRRVRWLAAAASVGAIAVAATSAIIAGGEPSQVAVAMRVDGHVTRDAGLLHASRALSPDHRVYVGDELVTGNDSRIALSVSDGIELRVDAGTHVRFTDSDRVLLEQGGVYVASEPGASTRFVVATDRASVRHIGTQYQVRVTASHLRVSVREGRVVVDTEGALHEGRAGEVLQVGRDGSVARSESNERDRSWQWVSAIAPSFQIENRSLDEFLSWFTHETGRSVEFADAAIEADARRAVLRGSIAGLDPYAALDAVLATVDLRSEEKPDGTIVISL